MSSKMRHTALSDLLSPRWRDCPRISAPVRSICMSFQVFIKTEKSLHQLASEIGTHLSLPPFKRQRTRDALYYQFEMLGMLVILHYLEEEDRAPEVLNYPYVFTLELTFTEHDLDT